MTDVMASPAVDLTMLRRLSPDKEAPPGAFVAEVIGLFRAHARARLEALESAAAAGDLAAAARAAHGLKGSGAHLGAARLALLCAELEVVAATGARADVPTAAQAIADELLRVLSALEQADARTP